MTGSCRIAWAPAFRHELEATQLLVRALRALSKHYNLSAANHLEQLVKAYRRSLVVSDLQ